MVNRLSLTLLVSIAFLSGNYAQNTPLDRYVFDSLSRIMPHENQVQIGEIFLETAQLIWDSLPEKTYSYLDSAQKISIKEGNSLLKAHTRLVSGDYFSRRQQFFLAQEQFHTALLILDNCRDTVGEMEALSKIGELNIQLENYPRALEYFQQGIGLATKVRDNQNCGGFHNLIALVYQRKGDTVTALMHYRKALKYFMQSGNKRGALMVQGDIGSLLLDQKRYKEALALYLGLLHDGDPSDGINLGIVYTRIGHTYQQLNQEKQSLEYNLKALRVRRNLTVPHYYISSLINVAGDYFLLGKPDSGYYYMDRGLRLAKKHYLKNYIQNGYRHLSTYFFRVGKFKEALENYKLYMTISDSIMMERNRGNISIIEANQRITGMEETNKFLKKQNEIQTLNLASQKVQYFFVRLLAAFGIIFMIIILIRLLYDRKMRQNMQGLYFRLTREKNECETLQQQTWVREQQYRFLAENSIDFITRINSKNQRIYASPSSKEIYGYEPEEMLTKNPFDTSHPDFISYFEENLSEMLKKRSERQLVYKARRKNGSFFWVESVLNPVFDRVTGEFKEFVGVTRDIQERKTIEMQILEGTRQKENLLKEIHHRVKNNFAVLVSLINMQMGQSDNPELRKSLSNLQLRIRTMALVHEMLYRSKDFEKISFPDYIRSLASVVAGSFNRRNIHVSIDTDEAVMDIESSIPLGLIINEVLSNSYKHGFPGESPGTIRIVLRKMAEDQTACLTIQDDGIGLPAGLTLEKSHTMGLQIIQILGKQLDGEVVLKTDQGTLFSLCFPNKTSLKIA